MNPGRVQGLSDERAFTLFELLIVLLIVGFMTAAALERYSNLSARYERMVVYAAVAELNARENLTWAREILSPRGFQDDVTLFERMDTNLGKDYGWMGTGPTARGGMLVFRGTMAFELARTDGTRQSPGRWAVHEQ